jgi:lysophospholipase L1-like esterase
MDTQSSRKRSRLGANLTLLGGVLLVCLVLAEIALRVAGVEVRPPEVLPFTYDDTLGWVGKPHFETVYLREGLRIPFEMNSWGFRDDEPPPSELASTKRRAMLLGDSYAMGFEIPKAERASELLEAADTTLLVYNFGILAYSTDQELLVLKKFGPAVHPDWVLLFFCINDIYYSQQTEANNQPKPFFRLRQDGQLELANMPLPQPVVPNPVATWITARTALGKVCSLALARIGVALRPPQSPTRREKQEQWFVGREGGREERLLTTSTDQITELTYHLLQEMRDESQRLGAQLMVFMCPSNKSWTESRDDSPEAILLASTWLQELQVPYLDLFPLFRQDYLAHSAELYIYDKMHWNARGNRLVADVALKAMQEMPYDQPGSSE